MSVNETPAGAPAKRKRNRGLDVFRAKVKAMSLFEANLEKVGDKLFRFKPGWSDRRIADETGAEIHVVRHMRATLFGNLALSQSEGGHRSMKTIRYAALVTQVADLTQRVSELTTEVNRLKAALGD